MVQYEAVVGINYRSSRDGEETRVEAGDKIVDMTDTAIRHELSVGNIREVEQTKKSAEKKGGKNDVNTGVQSEARIES